ncbi:MAG: hypothetical protein IKA03_04700 [Alphaproteobacteria bacterium]|nr:hypothetical protein [Alphaproteobacteria bacterium]
MEELLLIPQPTGVVIAAFALAFIVTKIPDKVHDLENKLHIEKLGTLLIAVLLFVPLLFADWKGVEVLVAARQVLGYLAMLFMGYLVGIMSVNQEKEP